MASGAVPAAGGGQRGATACALRSDHAPHYGTGAARYPPGDLGARPAGTRHAMGPGNTVERRQGPRGLGGGADLSQGACIVRTGWRDATAVADGDGLLLVPCAPGGVVYC